MHVAELVEALAGEGAQVLVLVCGVTHVALGPAPGVRVESLPGPGKGASAAEHLAAKPKRSAWIEGRLRDFGADALYERLAHRHRRHAAPRPADPGAR